MSRLIETTILFLACGVLPAQEGQKGSAGKAAPKADAAQAKPEARSDAKSPSAAQFEELAKKQAERMKPVRKIEDQEGRMAAINEALAKRAEDLKGFLAQFPKEKESTPARLELARIAMQVPALKDQAAEAMKSIDLAKSDFKEALGAAMMAKRMGLDDKKDEWLKQALAKATLLEDRLEAAMMLNMGMQDEEGSKKLFAEIEKAAKTDDERAKVLLQKVTMARYSRDDAGAKEVLAEIVKLYPETPTGKLAKGKIAAASLKAGSELIPFTAKDLDGKPVSPADYKGKVLLIDFWATWCGPCMHELPNVMTTYKEYHGKGFEVLGISLDNELPPLTACLKENKENGMTWRQVYDGKGWQTEISQLYDVMGIPFTILVGKDGKVLATNVRGEKLGQKVKEALESGT